MQLKHEALQRENIVTAKAMKSLESRLDKLAFTIGKLVGASAICPQPLWTAYFIEAQVYEFKENDLYQDNMSTM